MILEEIYQGRHILDVRENFINFVKIFDESGEVRIMVERLESYCCIYVLS